MTPEAKLKALLNFHWKGFREYDELPSNERVTWGKVYTIEELYDIIKGAYNIGVETAAENANILSMPTGGDPPDYDYVVDTKSILKLKI